MSHVQFRLFLFWILKMFERAWMDISHITPNDVSDTLWREIYNILRDKELSTLFIVLKSYGLLDYSKNIINEFEIESELKILNVVPEKLIPLVQSFWAQEVFDWEISDMYFDYQDGRFDADVDKERSFRIRRRTDVKNWKEQVDYFYTLKRKEKALEWRTTRDAFEKEYKIFWFDQFFQIIEQFGLRPYRAKTKKRISYSIEEEHVKFDFDFYEGIPPLLEIECGDEMAVKKYMKLLHLEDHSILRTGSRGLFKYYWKMDDYISLRNNVAEFEQFMIYFRKVG